MERVHVRNIKGRYPHHARRLDPANIEAQVTEECRIVRVRIDDAEHPEMWLEITLEISEVPQ